MKYVSLMVPVYNEQDNIEKLIQHLSIKPAKDLKLYLSTMARKIILGQY